MVVSSVARLIIFKLLFNCLAESTTNKLSASLGKALINVEAFSIPACFSISSSFAFPNTNGTSSFENFSTTSSSFSIITKGCL